MQPWSQPTSAAVLVGYDCPATQDGERRRRRLRTICRPHMERVQYSVYLGTLPRAEIRPMEDDLRGVIDPDLDRLLIADLGAGVWRSHGQGMPSVRLPPAALIVVAESSASLAAAAQAVRQPRNIVQRTPAGSPVGAPDHGRPGPCERVGRGLDVLGGRIVGFIDWVRSS